MQFEVLTLKDGIAAGLARGREAFPAFAGQLTHAFEESLGDSLWKVLMQWPVEAHPRFVFLFAELSAIAAVARAVNQEAPLSEDDLRSFLGHSFAFFNSFKHR